MQNQFPRFALAVLLGLIPVFGLRGADTNILVSARTASQWLRSGIVYEVFPRDFSAGGNLNGVTEKLDDLKSLGVNILWLMPIHPIGLDQRKGSYGSPYAARDYYAVNPDYGTKDDLQRLDAQSHERGMKVIVDIVLLHTAWDSVMMSHPEFYKHDARGKIISPMPQWNDVAGLNYENIELRQYLVAMMKYWIKEVDLDGYRCDTASLVPTSFWEEARAALAQIKPDIIMLAEADKPELLTNAFDIDYAWPLLNTLRKVLGQSAPASEIQRTWQNDVTRYPQGALHLTMSDNHDQPRVVSRFGVSGALAASALMFTLNGVPLIYNGMEVGDSAESHDPALFEKVPINWHHPESAQFTGIYHDLIRLRKQYPAFQTDNVQWLHNSDESKLITFARTNNEDEFLVAINFSDHPLQGKIYLKDGERFEPVKIAGLHNSDARPISDLRLDGFEWRIYHRRTSLAVAK